MSDDARSRRKLHNARPMIADSKGNSQAVCDLCCPAWHGRVFWSWDNAQCEADDHNAGLDEDEIPL